MPSKSRLAGVEELDFIQLVRNHREFKRQLEALGLSPRLAVYDRKVRGVCCAWLGLAHQHLREAKRAKTARLGRSVYSRAYYAAYSASKALRYLTAGVVSLHGDDHKKVGDLPADFPNLAAWTLDLSVLYEHRLRADYDNWTKTKAENKFTLAQALDKAEAFVRDCETYLQKECGIQL